MIPQELLQSIVVKNQTKIVMLIIDGLGGVASKDSGKTELESAHKPNMDKLARVSMLGLLDMIHPGITPGSGPGHLALFGYNPIKHIIGRGILSALGIGFNIQKDDLAIRGNFATIDTSGKITDRRAGRISTNTCNQLCLQLSKKIKKIDATSVFIEPEKEHRFVLIFRSKGLSEKVTDTDPQKEGLKILQAQPLETAATKTAELVNKFTKKAIKVLKGSVADSVLLRGYAKLPDIKKMNDLYKLNSACIATYPMYKGLARLVGMHIITTSEDENLELLAKKFEENLKLYDFFYIHVKKTDSYGEDGNFQKKVEAIELVDRILIRRIVGLNPDVLVITGDHSTPSVMKSHSWHPVPVLFYCKLFSTSGAKSFGESECRNGALGRMTAMQLMPLILAHSSRLTKFGA